MAEGRNSRETRKKTEAAKKKKTAIESSEIAGFRRMVRFGNREPWRRREG